MDTSLRSTSSPSTSTSATINTRRPNAPARTEAPDNTSVTTAPLAPVAVKPPRRGLAHWDTQLQGDVARAQQAKDYLHRVASELEGVKSALSAKLAGTRSNGRELEARARQLAAALSARTRDGGGAVNLRLEFNANGPAQQEFLIAGMDIESLRAAAPVSLAFSVDGAGGPNLAAVLEPEMDGEQIAARLDRTLAPLKVRARLDHGQRLVFSTDEANWPAVRDSVAISGRGRAATQAVSEMPDLIGSLPSGGSQDAETLRQHLREVVQALERVRRSEAAASNALAAAAMRTVEPEVTPDQLVINAQDFAATASSHNYESLLAITSALVGVSRERVLALLGQR